MLSEDAKVYNEEVRAQAAWLEELEGSVKREEATAKLEGHLVVAGQELALFSRTSDKYQQGF